MTRLRVAACLSLTGKFARFGAQAAYGLRAWQALDGDAELVIEDDKSSPRVVASLLPALAARCDVLLGPYSTQLTRTAGQVAADRDLLLWNHGGSGDDVESAQPGHVVSLPAPTSRYAEPFLRRLSGMPGKLRIVHGPGPFGRQVAAGAAAFGLRLGFDPVVTGSLADPPDGEWDLFCAGRFEEDVENVRRAFSLPNAPRNVGAVAAGVRDFADAVGDVDAIFGVAQWFPGRRAAVRIGPAEADFLAAYDHLAGTVPDYPAVQAAAAAVIAAHCFRAAGRARADLWSAAAVLRTETLYGRFAIDPVTGMQTGHETVLVRWAKGHQKQRLVIVDADR